MIPLYLAATVVLVQTPAAAQEPGEAVPVPAAAEQGSVEAIRSLLEHPGAGEVIDLPGEQPAEEPQPAPAEEPQPAPAEEPEPAPVVEPAVHAHGETVPTREELDALLARHRSEMKALEQQLQGWRFAFWALLAGGLTLSTWQVLRKWLGTIVAQVRQYGEEPDPAPAVEPEPAPAEEPEPAPAEEPEPAPVEEPEPAEEEGSEWDRLVSAILPDSPADEPKLPEPLQKPYPGFEEPVDDVPTPEYMQGLWERYSLGDWARSYRDTARQAETAARFCEWAGGREAEECVLLHAEEGEHYWFAADVHASLPAALKLYAHVWEMARQGGGVHCLVLLGDYVDRGPDSLPLLCFLQEMVMQCSKGGPVRLLLLKGNHDAGFGVDGEFFSDVYPSEMVGELNGLAAEMPQEAGVIGRAALELFRLAPYAAEITGLGGEEPECSILLTHGGVPHTDLLPGIYAAAPESPDRTLLGGLPQELREACLEDLLWVRLEPDVPSIAPDRSFGGCEAGTLDVNLFRYLHWLRTGRAVSFIIRGHDHRTALDSCAGADESAAGCRQRHCGVLTLQSREPDEDEPQRDIGLAYWSRGGAVVLYRLPTEPRGGDEQ